MNATDPRPSLLPGFLKQPLMLLWLWVIPQTALLLLNLRAWNLAAGEMSARQAATAGWLGAAGAALLLAGMGAWVAARLSRRTVGLSTCLLGLLLNVAYLWLFLSQLEHAWPSAVAPWMLPQTEVVFYQFALVMPALFYCVLRLACVELPLRRGADIGLSFTMFAAVPLAWYILFHLIELLSHRFFRGSFEATAIVFFAGSTVLLMMAFLRLLNYLYFWLSERIWGQTAMTAVAGLLCPVGGLLLNSVIPFPCDLQSVGVYVLAVLNGLVLIAPLSRRAGLAALTVWARSALSLFTLYFFVVFLPFLPLSLVAMIACGAGFLILAPTLLFVIHARRLASDAAALAARFGRLPAAALLLAGWITLPAIFTARAWIDRQALTAALNAVYSPDLRRADAALNTRAVSHALNNLRAMKDGIYLPFLSDAYNRLVFNGMVLPDDKMETLSRVLLGRPAPAQVRSDRFSFFLAPRAVSRWGGGANRTLPPRDVTPRPPVIEDRTVSNGVARSTLRLELVNAGPANSEYVGSLTLPDGVLVSGFWLDVAGRCKPGTIVEKKTALWVYHMIRDFTRRDPGLLIYEREGELKLSVFPFAAGETRTVRIELMAPAALDAPVLVNAVPLPPAEAQGQPAAACLVQPAGAALVPGTVLSSLPRTQREPIVHFIIERSAAASGAVEIPAAARDAAALAGGRCRVTFANFASVDAVTAPVDPAGADAAARAAERSGLDARGGFAPDRVIPRVLLASGSDPDAAGAAPLFVIIPAPGSTAVKTLDLAPFAKLAPDVPAYYLWATDHLDRVSFSSGALSRADTLARPEPAVVFRAVGEISVLLPGAPSALIDLRGATGSREAGGGGKPTLEVYNPSAGAFESLPVPLQRLEDAAYADGARLLLDSRRVSRDPASLDAALAVLVGRSRSSGILCPLTSYMVVENTAQEKTLAARQRQSLGAHHALEFEELSLETPEPGLLWLLPVAALILWRAGRSGRTRARSGPATQ